MTQYPVSGKSMMCEFYWSKFTPSLSFGCEHLPGVVTNVKSFLARGDFCHLLITFVNSLDQDQD